MANFRVDQAWGSGQIMGAIHDVSGQYYNTGAGIPCPGNNLTCDGNPSNKIGWAVGIGGKFNTPMVGVGDYFQFQVNYAQGASGYPNAFNAFYSIYDGGAGGKYGFGVMNDSVYGQGGDIELTTSWGVNAAFEHHWNPHWQTSIYGAYVATNFGDTANDALCDGRRRPGACWALTVMVLRQMAATTTGRCGPLAPGRNGTSTARPILVSTLCTQTSNRLSNGVHRNVAAGGNQPAALRSISDQSALMGQFRVHRNFYP